MDDTLTGKLLVAMPGIGDARFERSVIMLCAHTADHAMGIVINKPKEELTLGDVLDHLGISVASSVAPRIVLDGGQCGPIAAMYCTQTITTRRRARRMLRPAFA